jgi:hypothetical protein
MRVGAAMCGNGTAGSRLGSGSRADPDLLLIDARQALARGAWEEARRRFEAALTEEETPEALEGLGSAAWWLEDAPTVLASRARAYRLFREQGDRLAAGRLATELGYDYAVFRAELAVCTAGCSARTGSWMTSTLGRSRLG